MLKNLSILLIISIMCACNSEVTQQLDSKNTALGRLNQIVVVADPNIWESTVGDTFRYYFESAYPLLPAPEAIFDLKYYTPEEIQNVEVRREFRTYTFLADLSDEASPTTKMVKKDMGNEKFNQALKMGTPTTSVGRDKWAKGQLLVYLFGQNQDSIKSTIRKAFPAVARRVNKHDESILNSMVYAVITDVGLSEDIQERYNININIPTDYVIARDDKVNNVTWLRKNTNKADYHIVFRKFEYTDPNQISKESIINMRNAFGKEYVTSDVPNNFMVVNDEDLPVYEYTLKLDNKYAKEVRGIWEMTEEFTGGPFCTYVIVDEENGELTYIDTFVLAPGQKKRNLMMQLDHLVKSGMES